MEQYNESIFISRKQFQAYRSVSTNTTTKLYRQYLKIAGKEMTQELTIYDLSNIDKLPLKIVKSRLGY